MGAWKYRKPEPLNVRGVCCVEGCNNLQTSRGEGKYRPICSVHHRMRNEKAFEYRNYKGLICEVCGFVPQHSCQLDVDHINGDHSDNREENLQTLCANCHRLKTFMCKDGAKKKGA